MDNSLDNLNTPDVPPDSPDISADFIIPITPAETLCGTVAIIGRPNVGKSTLLNKILGQKISITCRKPQTTRHQILGIKTENNIQTVYVDTPGMHKTSTRAINRYMNRTARRMIFDVDVVIFLIDADKWTPEEDFILSEIKNAECPVILAINKSDTVRHKLELLPWIKTLSEKHNFTAIIPISGKHGHHLEDLEKIIHQNLPKQIFMFPEDQITDRSNKFLASEIIREKLMRFLGDELPYDITVEMDHMKEIEKERGKGTMMDIAATIYVERPSQKPIIIGKEGEKLKEIGKQARLDLQVLFEKKIFLTLWVKVKSGWADDEKALQSLGYD